MLHVKLLKVISQSSSLLKHCFFERVQTSAFKNCERRTSSSWDVLPLNLEMMSALCMLQKQAPVCSLWHYSGDTEIIPIRKNMATYSLLDIFLICF